jgi:hypothetical protein
MRISTNFLYSKVLLLRISIHLTWGRFRVKREACRLEVLDFAKTFCLGCTLLLEVFILLRAEAYTGNFNKKHFLDFLNVILITPFQLARSLSGNFAAAEESNNWLRG